MKQYKLERAVERYAKSKASLGKAAEEAGLTLWEMMDTLKEKNVPNPLTKEDHMQGLKNLQKAFSRRKVSDEQLARDIEAIKNEA